MAPNLMKAALAVLVLGSAPLHVYTLFNPAGGYPVGLDMLAQVSIPLAILLAASSGTVFLRQSWRQRATS